MMLQTALFFPVTLDLREGSPFTRARLESSTRGFFEGAGLSADLNASSRAAVASAGVAFASCFAPASAPPSI